MLLRNMDRTNGLCNGTVLIVKQLGTRVIEAKVLNGSHAGNVVFLPRITLSPSDGIFPFTLKRRQFPIRLAFAMTINKSQGQTISNVGIYLPAPVFGHGQLYVAFSRSGDPNGVKVLIVPVEKEQGQLYDDGQMYTRNVVYKAVVE